MKRLGNIFWRTVKNQQPPKIELGASDLSCHALPPELWPPGDTASMYVPSDKVTLTHSIVLMNLPGHTFRPTLVEIVLFG